MKKQKKKNLKETRKKEGHFILQGYFINVRKHQKLITLNATVKNRENNIFEEFPLIILKDTL